MLSFPVPQDKGNVGSENEIGVDFWRMFQFAEFIQRGDINCHQLFKGFISQYLSEISLHDASRINSPYPQRVKMSIRFVAYLINQIVIT